MVVRAFSSRRNYGLKSALAAHLCVAFFAVVFGSWNAQAEKVDETQLNQFLQSELLHDLVNDALQHVPPVVFRKCPGLVSEGSTVTVVNPMSFDADGGPETGAWRMHIPVSGCGNDTSLNIVFSAKPGKYINYTVMLPGDTRADTTLQRDAVMYALAGAKLVAKDCETIEITNTKFDGFGLTKPPSPGPVAAEDSRPWQETWTLDGCGHRLDVPMQFAPDRHGTQIIQPGGVVERH
jgi:hypothetical protein